MKIQEAIATAVTTLSETFRQPLTDAGAMGYVIGLDDLTQEQLAVATKRAIRESKFMPSPAELRGFAGKDESKSIARRAAIAWEAALAAAHRHDYTTSVDFGPLVNAVIRNLGGWVKFCDGPADPTWQRKRFEEVFALLAEQDASSLHGQALAGAFGGAPVPVLIPGETPVTRQLGAVGDGPGARDLARQLAEAKSQ
jgi:hypothetical protein